MKTGTLRARLGLLPMTLAVTFSAASFAQNGQNDVEMAEIVVTATRTVQRADAVVGDVTVIDAGTLQAFNGRSLSEVLTRVAGVQMSSNGGLGKSSSIYIRGTENRHVLLLVDGMRYGSSTSGTPNLDTIPLEMIERIEVLKGPASALYGSDAVGGVVQIFTRKGKRGLHPYASVTVGEGDRAELSTGLQGASDALTYALGVHTVNENGFSATNPAVGTGFNADRDGFSQNAVNASFDWKLTEQWKIYARLLQTEGLNHYDGGAGAFDVRAKFDNVLAKMGVQGQLHADWKSRLETSYTTDKSTNFTSAATGQFNTEQEQWSWQNELDSGWGMVSAGVDYLNEKVSGTQAYAVRDRSTTSVYVGIAGEAQAHSWQLNSRHDKNSQFGTATTGLVAYGYKLTPDLRLHGAHGTSFKVPSFNKLYWVDLVTPANNGNPTTQPESGENTELGVKYTLGDHLLSLVHYQNRIKGYISTTPTVTNIPYVRVQGWTLALQGQTGAWDYRTAMDWVDARNESTDKRLTRRPTAQLSTSANYTVADWKWGASWLAATDFYDDASNAKPLGGYGTLDIYAGKSVAKDWSLEGRVVNLGDKWYQTALGYNQPGRSAYVTLRYQPK